MEGHFAVWWERQPLHYYAACCYVEGNKRKILIYLSNFLSKWPEVSQEVRQIQNQENRNLLSSMLK